MHLESRQSSRATLWHNAENTRLLSLAYSPSKTSHHWLMHGNVAKVMVPPQRRLSEQKSFDKMTSSSIVDAFVDDLKLS